MSLPKSYGIAAGWPMGCGRPSFGVGLRTVPATADKFYIVGMNAEGSADAVQVERNIGGATSSSNLGVKWPEWRYTGKSRLASFLSDPTNPSLVFFADNGAQDVVANNGGSLYLSSFHGLGTAGSLNSETLTIDGRTLDPTTAQTGLSIEIRNSTTATNGTTTFTRDLSMFVNSSATVSYRINDASATAASFYYAAMLTGSGAYNEFDFRVTDGGAWITAPPMGTGPGNGYVYSQIACKAVRLRNTTTGAAVIITSSTASLKPSYVRTELERTSSSDRLKCYLGRFTDVADIIGLEWTEGSEVVAPGSFYTATQLLTNGDFATGDLTGWTKASGTATPTVVADAMVHTRDASTQRERQTAGFTVTTADVTAYAADLLSLSAGAAPFLRVSTATSMSATGAMVNQQYSIVGRNIHVFLPTVTTIYVGMEFGSGTAGQTCSTDNYILSKLA